MNRNIYKGFGLLTIALFAFLGCEEEEGHHELTLPSNLTFTIEKAPDSKKVEVAAAATNANFFNVYFGEGANTPVRSNDGKATYTYSGSGTYTIRVQAHTTTDKFISESKEVVITEPSNIPSTGYTTPESYEGMELVWRDEFDGDELNTDDWTFEFGGHGWGNNELQYYREENVTVGEGVLVITAKKESYQGSEYTSSRIITKGKQSFQYGRVDIRAALPEGQGIWPALWMLGASFPDVQWPASGEIDIMEMIGGSGRENTVHGTVHWDNAGNHASYGDEYSLSSGTFADEFHVFSIVWDEDRIRWYVDDVQFNEIDITPAELSEFHNEFFFIFNVAVGGNWPQNPDGSTEFPQQMIVDYVRVFQPQ